MAGWKEVFQVIGLASPFMYAGATYAAFRFLDKKASPGAKKAISNWIAGPSYDRSGVSAAIVEIFDRIYTRPLWGWRAIVRSFAFSVIVTAIIWYELKTAEAPDFEVFDPFVLRNVATTLIADYISIYIIRMLLRMGSKFPLIALLVALVAGCAIIFVTQLISVTAWNFAMSAENIGLGTPIFLFWDLVQMVTTGTFTFWLFFAPAFAVHLWLPLFALVVMLAQFVNGIRWTTRWVQWFIARGRSHPFEALGYISTILVFVGTAVPKLLA